MRHDANALVDCPACGSWHTVIVEGEDVWSVCGCNLSSEQFDEVYQAAIVEERKRTAELNRRRVQEAVDHLTVVIGDSAESTSTRAACMAARSDALDALGRFDR